MLQGRVPSCWLGQWTRTSTELLFVFIWQILSLAFEMMGLGNGRRTMKSPPLVLAALVACVIVLGFNYWIASSRSVDLQVFCLSARHRVFNIAEWWGARACLSPPEALCSVVGTL